MIGKDTYYAPVNLTVDGTKFLEAVRYSREQIAKVFAVPPWMVITGVPRPGRLRRWWDTRIRYGVLAAAHERVGRAIKRAFK